MLEKVTQKVFPLIIEDVHKPLTVAPLYLLLSFILSRLGGLFFLFKSCVFGGSLTHVIKFEILTRDESFESQEVRGSKILIVEFYSNYGIILWKKKEFELQKLRIMKIRNHSQKSEKVTNISNMIGTDAQHTQGGERAWW